MITAERKAARVARAKAHIQAGRLRQGTLFNGSVSCDAIDILGPERAAQTEDVQEFFALVAAHDGSAEWLERLRDIVFEKLPDDRPLRWHVELAEALPVGRDLAPYHHRICLGLLRIALTHSDMWPTNCRDAVVDFVRRMAELHRRQERNLSVWEAAKSAGEDARAVAESACRSAARSADPNESAMTAAEGAAESALRAFRSATWSAWTPFNSDEDDGSGSWCRSASQCADEAAWSVAFGVLAASGEPLRSRMPLSAWIAIADLILDVLTESPAEGGRKESYRP